MSFHPYNHFKTNTAFSHFNTTEIANIYNFPSGNGSSQRIGIVQLGGMFVEADLNQYFLLLGLGTPPTINIVYVDGAVQVDTSDSVEVALDVQIIASLVPNATITIYFGVNSFQGFYNCIREAGENNDIVSVSWGTDEIFVNNTYKTNYKNLFDSLSSSCVILIASGDNGSTGIHGVGNNVGFPASVPSCVSCGGTTLLWNGTSIQSETVWNGSGGGYSTYYTRPIYQNSIVTNSYRGVPDVSGNADPNTGYLIIYDGNNYVVGGTSAVAPLYAALIARINQNISTKIYQVNNILYNISNLSYYDVRTGNNGAYSASIGWDASTGLGRPDGTTLMNNISAYATDNPSVTVTSLSPTSGIYTGGTSVTINGLELSYITNILFNGINANINSSSNTSIQITTPESSVIGDIVVQFYNNAVLIATSSYKYIDTGRPTISSVNPSGYPVNSQTNVTLTGTNLKFVSSVKFNNQNANIITKTSTQIIARLPSITKIAAVSLSLANSIGSMTLPNRFQIYAIPRINRISATTGKISGNYKLTISGTFGIINSAMFGDISISLIGTSTSKTFTAPRHATGYVNLVITDNYGFVYSKNNIFRYTN
jgi:hypothetical protein